MLSDSNQILIRTQDEQQLLQEVCEVIVQEGDDTLARVALAGPDDAADVTAVRLGTDEDASLVKRVVEWTNLELGRSPASTAIRTKEPILYEDLAAKHPLKSQGDEPARPSRGSLIVLPLTTRERVLAVLAVRASDPDSFNRREIELLSELVADLACGVMALCDREERRQAEETLRLPLWPWRVREPGPVPPPRQLFGQARLIRGLPRRGAGEGRLLAQSQRQAA